MSESTKQCCGEILAWEARVLTFKAHQLAKNMGRISTTDFEALDCSLTLEYSKPEHKPSMHPIPFFDLLNNPTGLFN